MEHKTIKAYRYFKDEDPSYLILFHVRDHYEAFLDDAVRLASLTGKPAEDIRIGPVTTIKKFTFPEKEIQSYMCIK